MLPMFLRQLLQPRCFNSQLHHIPGVPRIALSVQTCPRAACPALHVSRP